MNFLFERQEHLTSERSERVGYMAEIEKHALIKILGIYWRLHCV